MKLLLDEQISPRLVGALQGAFPGTAHVHTVGLGQAEDREIWLHAKVREFVIVTKDADFLDLAAALGHPPKVVWLRGGNSSTAVVRDTLLAGIQDMLNLDADPELAVLALG